MPSSEARRQQRIKQLAISVGKRFAHEIVERNKNCDHRTIQSIYIFGSAVCPKDTPPNDLDIGVMLSDNNLVVARDYWGHNKSLQEQADEITRTLGTRKIKRRVFHRPHICVFKDEDLSKDGIHGRVAQSIRSGVVVWNRDDNI